MEFDCSVIVDDRTSFHINNGQGASCTGVLPGSVSNVSIIYDYENRDNRSDLVETMIKQLGSSVVSLDLPNQYKFTRKDLSWLGRITCYAVEPMTLTAGLLGPQINYIHIANLVGPLAAGVLPSALETLVDYNKPLAANVLPASL
ncbi:hypothetical protein CYY_009627 [Polysphondylium violaceum]|uniref:Uncharacterized protein n=1 Tax=Polysphondylium violaceum TaxID=133409 RepID=A0A8J4PJU7_9MYCE|nr:hypothetical protein CYY_009627 [Polysphondylium violaceum]